MNSNYYFSLNQINQFYGILSVYFQRKDLEPEPSSIERWLFTGAWKTFLNCIWNDFLICLQGHQRINLRLATVLTPAGEAKEMIHRASRQIPDDIQGKIAYQKPKEPDSEDVCGPKPKFFVPQSRLFSHWHLMKLQACAVRMPQHPQKEGGFRHLGHLWAVMGFHLWVVAWAALQSTVGTRVMWGFLAPHAALWPGCWGGVKEKNIWKQITLKPRTLQHPKIIPILGAQLIMNREVKNWDRQKKAAAMVPWKSPSLAGW